MEQREYNWLQNKAGWISSSRLDELVSDTGLWTKGNISYLREIERQRQLKQPSPPIHSRALRIGIENEKYAVAWLRENHPEWIITHCDADYPEKIFIKTPFGFGCSPDTYIVSDSIPEMIQGIVEIKCVVGLFNLCFYFSNSISFEEKRIMAFTEHRHQLAGQLIAFPKLDEIYLMKYDPQLDEDEFDTRPVTDPTRGILFNYKRGEFGSLLVTLKMRTSFANSFLMSGKPMNLINAEWDLFLRENNK